MNFKTKPDRETSKLEPPHSTDTERAVLGAVLRDADALNSVIDILDEPEHFYVPKHREIFRAMLHLYNSSEACDLTTVADELLRVGMLEQIGGRVYLVGLVEDMRSAANAAEYARRILDYSLTRRLISASTEIIESCQGSDREVEALLDDAERTIFDISEKRIRKGFVHIKSPLHDTIERLDS
ncbi:MAG: replicative DNA helicase, partial [candidate division Zixibacteria bacterium]|nr:replicative DNA helicase [candidate division Zixibacteria bacterium]